eukprot:g52931.t1
MEQVPPQYTVWAISLGFVPFHANFDLASLKEWTEDSFLSNVKQRFERDAIYTNVGTVLISVNPFKSVSGLYSEERLAQYLSQDTAGLAPHIYSIGRHAYQQVLDFHRHGQSEGSVSKPSQSLIISGESGAGKTEATKQLIEFLVYASRHKGHNRQTSHERIIAQKLILASPVLEAFGNAKTMRNKNSSRFGKWQSIFFNSHGGIKSAKITRYLLEESRVSFQEKGERNYHIFYQLCASSDLDPLSFAYLNGSSSVAEDAKSDWNSKKRAANADVCVKVDGVDDAKDFSIVAAALDHLGVPKEESRQIFQVVHSILTLGNVNFTGNEKGHSEVTDEKSKDMVKQTATFLALDEYKLDTILTSRIIQSGRGSIISVPRTVQQSVEFRNSLAQQLYANVFHHIVLVLNECFGDGVSSHGDTSVSILDIFGFEVFAVNSFEQFCINYANEKLQYDFINHMVVMELDIYREEGVEIKMDFMDNSACLHLLEGKPHGILRMLSEELAVPKGSDHNLLLKLNKNWSGKNRYYRELRGKDQFQIVHYAQPVDYTISGFLHKAKAQNMDEVTSMFTSSSSSYLKSLFENASVPSGLGKHNSLGADLPSPQQRKRSKSRTRSAVGAHSVSEHFQESLQELIGAIRQSNAHFIRCIKPNPDSKQDDFTTDMVLRQLRTSGLMDAVKVRRQGFSHHLPHKDFVLRYRALAAPSEDSFEDQAKQIIQGCGFTGKNLFAIGTSKVLLRSEFRAFLEEKRAVMICEHSIKIQAAARTFLAEQNFAEIRNAWLRVQNSLSVTELDASQEALSKCEKDANAFTAFGHASLNAEIQHNLQRLDSIRKLQESLLAALNSQSRSMAARLGAATEACSAGKGLVVKEGSFAAVLQEILSKLAQGLQAVQAVLHSATQDAKMHASALRSGSEKVLAEAKQVHESLQGKLASVSSFRPEKPWQRLLDEAGNLLILEELVSFNMATQEKLKTIQKLSNMLDTAERNVLGQHHDIANILSTTEIPMDIKADLETRLSAVDTKAQAIRDLVTGFTSASASVKDRLKSLDDVLQMEMQDSDGMGASLRKAAIAFREELAAFSAQLEQAEQVAHPTKAQLAEYKKLIKSSDARCRELVDAHLKEFQSHPDSQALRNEILEKCKPSVLREPLELLTKFSALEGSLHELWVLVDSAPIFTTEQTRLLESQAQDVKSKGTLSTELQQLVKGRLTLLRQGMSLFSSLSTALTSDGDSFYSRRTTLQQALSRVPPKVEAELSASTRSLIVLARDLCQSYEMCAKQVESALSLALSHESHESMDVANSLLSRFEVLRYSLEAFTRRCTENEGNAPVLDAATIQEITRVHSSTGTLTEVRDAAAVVARVTAAELQIEKARRENDAAMLGAALQEADQLGMSESSVAHARSHWSSLTSHGAGGASAVLSTPASLHEKGRIAASQVKSEVVEEDLGASLEVEIEDTQGKFPAPVVQSEVKEEGKVASPDVQVEDIVQSKVAAPGKQSEGVLPGYGGYGGQASDFFLLGASAEQDPRDDSLTDEAPEERNRLLRDAMRSAESSEGSETDEDLNLQTRGRGSKKSRSAKNQQNTSLRKGPARTEQEQHLLVDIQASDFENVKERSNRFAWGVIGIVVCLVVFGVVFWLIMKYTKTSQVDCPNGPYDFIVVGGGAVGCALAASLVEKGKVLLIERGGLMTENAKVEDFIESLTRIDGTRMVTGMGQGGSTLIGQGLYMREDLSSPFFTQGDMNIDKDLASASYQWVEQRLSFQDPDESLAKNLTSRSLEELGLLVSDNLRVLANGSSARSLLPLEHKNLTVFGDFRVEKILFRVSDNAEPQAMGVRIRTSDSSCKLSCECSVPGGEILLSAGGVHSAHLLMRSGVGPSSHLQSKGVQVIANTPGVGQYVDQPSIISYLFPAQSESSENAYHLQAKNIPEGFSWTAASRPDATIRKIERAMGAFLNASLRSDDIGLGRLSVLLKDPAFESSLRFHVSVLHPSSRGQLLLNANDFYTPIITASKFDKADLDTLKRSLDDLLVLQSQQVPICPSALNYDTSKLIFPSIGVNGTSEWISCNALPGWQLWGANNAAINTSTFRVLGVSNLRVLDSSAFSVPTNSPPQATLMMLGHYVAANLIG